MRRALLLLLTVIALLALPGCSSGTSPWASAAVIQPAPPPPPALLELPAKATWLTPGYFGGSAPSAGNATAEDVMANHKDNALRCLDLEAKYLALRKWALGLPQTVTVTEAAP